MFDFFCGHRQATTEIFEKNGSGKIKLNFLAGKNSRALRIFREGEYKNNKQEFSFIPVFRP